MMEESPAVSVPQSDGRIGISFLPDARAVEVSPGETILQAALRVGIKFTHACGGNARCTTCRVEFVSGEPTQMTVAERDVLKARGVTGVRLSCQIVCDHDMAVRAISRFEGSGRKDAGSPVATEIEPSPEWVNA